VYEAEHGGTTAFDESMDGINDTRGFHGFAHEMGPTADTAHPGDVRLDDEQDERMSLQSRRDAEEARLVKAHPKLTYVKVMFEMDSCWLNGKRWDAGERWNVFVSIGDFMGSGFHASDEAKAGDAAVANLKGKLDSVAVSRAKLLDNSASVAPSAESEAA
jgi:hypothetical protein